MEQLLLYSFRKWFANWRVLSKVRRKNVFCGRHWDWPSVRTNTYTRNYWDSEFENFTASCLGVQIFKSPWQKPTLHKVMCSLCYVKLSGIANFYTYRTKEAQPSSHNATYTSTYTSPSIQKMPLYGLLWNSKRKPSNKILWAISGYQNISTYMKDFWAKDNKQTSSYRPQTFHRNLWNSTRKNHLMFPITEMQRLLCTYCFIFTQLWSMALITPWTIKEITK
jgi:hypothetical protein